MKALAALSLAATLALSLSISADAGYRSHRHPRPAHRPASGLICPAFAAVINGKVVQITSCEVPSWMR